MVRVVIGLLLAASAAGAQTVTPGYTPHYEDVGGVRYRSFGNTGGEEVYVGIPDLGVAGNRLGMNIVWTAGANDVTFTYDQPNDKLTTTVVTGAGTYTKDYPGVAAQAAAKGKLSTVCDLDIMQITVANRDSGTTVRLEDVTLDGIPLGTFDGGTTPPSVYLDWMVTDYDFGHGFSIHGTLTLGGTFGGSQELSRVEIKVGRSAAEGIGCDDGNGCTADACNVTAGCENPAVPDTTPCDDGAFCNGADTCSGGACTHAGDPCVGGVECNDTCNEAAGNCAVAAGTGCTDDGTVCTTDVCDGAGVCSHPAGNAGTECRTAAGECDLAEACTGTSPDCPADAFKGGGTPCTDDGTVCTTDVCDGAGVCSHPAGNAGTECRTAAGECDLAEACTGTSPDCPADAFRGGGTPCTDDGNGCTDDQCNGAGGCDHPPNQATCEDGDACTSDDACSNGACVGGPPTDCDDGEPCTQDSCVPPGGCSNVAAPAPVCTEAGKSMFALNDKTVDQSDKIIWRWLKGPPVTLEEIGDPVNETDGYALCVYDTAAGVTRVALAAAAPTATDCPNSKPCWKRIGSPAAPRGFRYNDKDRTSDGMRKILLKTGGDGQSKLIVTAKGDNLPLPGPVSGDRYFDQDGEVIVQLVKGDGSACWGATFAAGARRNDGSRFIDKCGSGTHPACSE